MFKIKLKFCSDSYTFYFHFSKILLILFIFWIVLCVSFMFVSNRPMYYALNEPYAFCNYLFEHFWLCPSIIAPLQDKTRTFVQFTLKKALISQWQIRYTLICHKSFKKLYKSLEARMLRLFITSIHSLNTNNRHLTNND